MRYAAKRDATEPAILAAYRRVGARYLLLGDVDALVLFHGRVHLVEHKTPGGRRTATQQRLVDEGWPVHFAVTPDDALRAIGAIR